MNPNTNNERDFNATKSTSFCWMLIALLVFSSIYAPFPAFAHSDCTWDELHRYSIELATLSHPILEDPNRDLEVDFFEEYWGSELPHNQQFRCSLANMTEEDHFKPAGQVYENEIRRLDEDDSIPEKRILDAKDLYIDFLKLQKSQDANQPDHTSGP